MVFSCAKKLKGQRHADSEQLPSQLFPESGTNEKEKGLTSKEMSTLAPKGMRGPPSVTPPLSYDDHSWVY